MLTFTKANNIFNNIYHLQLHFHFIYKIVFLFKVNLKKEKSFSHNLIKTHYLNFFFVRFILNYVYDIEIHQLVIQLKNTILPKMRKKE